MNRRDVLGLLAAVPAAGVEAKRLRVSLFSKHLQWLGWADAAALAKQIGFDGIDLTVRDGGHVAPERVAQDLPKAVAAVRGAGLEAAMITAGIVDASSPHAEQILAAASALGIRRYRWGGFRYRDGEGIPQQLAALRPRVEALAKLNRKYGMCAMYHTHSGPGQVGAPIWDLYLLLKDFDPEVVSVNLDIGHATVEGGYGDWITTTKLILPFTRGTAIKDFLWERDAKGGWAPRWVPLGKGMVNFAGYFRLLKDSGFAGPVQLHYEYPELGGADTGKTKLSIAREDCVRMIRQDLETLRSLLRGAGLG